MKLKHVKLGAQIAVGYSVWYVTSNAIKNNVTPTSSIQRAEVVVAAFVLGSLAAKYAERHVASMIDDAAEDIQQAKKKIQEQQA